jgi:hypothetical protein
MKIMPKNKPNTNPNKANFGPISRVGKANQSQNKANSNPNVTFDVSSLALEFTLGCAYLFFCRGSGAQSAFLCDW